MIPPEAEAIVRVHVNGVRLRRCGHSGYRDGPERGSAVISELLLAPGA